MKQTSIVICAAMLLVAASGATHECRGDDAEVKDRQGEERAVVYNVLASSLDFNVAFEGAVNAVRDLDTAVRAKFADVPPNATVSSRATCSWRGSLRINAFKTLN